MGGTTTGSNLLCLPFVLEFSGVGNAFLRMRAIDDVFLGVRRVRDNRKKTVMVRGR
jgi:hypothetical protein